MSKPLPEWGKTKYVELWWCDHTGRPVMAAMGVVQLLSDLAREPFLATPEITRRAKEILTDPKLARLVS